MKRLYVSGGITGIPNHRARFEAGVRIAMQRGFVPVNPLDVPPCFDESCIEGPGNPRSNGHTWGCWLRHDLIALLQCDGVITLPGWETSKGAILEVTTALQVGMPLYHITEEELARALTADTVTAVD